MADQKAMKKRLKVLMQRPENQVCSDCPERQPRWASLIVPPPGSPPGALKIGAFCCLECSGSHRRLGVHISFVRSVNLDSWKENEVLAMENGGNRKVNAIWEANLQRMGGRKPTTGADLNTRERYIRDKYERRRFYDPQALSNYQNDEPAPVEQDQQTANFANFESASDAAKLRAEKKKKKQQQQQSIERTSSGENLVHAHGAETARARRLKRHESVPEPEPVADLLDFGGGGGADTSAAASTTQTNTNSSPFADFADFASGNNNSDAQPKSTNVQADIMAMYNNGSNNNPNANFGGMNPMMANMAGMGGLTQQMQQMNMNPQQQQQQQTTTTKADPMDAFASLAASSTNNNMAGQSMPQRQGMNPQMQQQGMPQQQMNPQLFMQMMQQMQMNQGRMSGGMPGMNPNMMGGMPAGGGNNNNMGGMMNPQMMMMMMQQQQQQQPGMNPQMMMQQQQPSSNSFGAFGGAQMGSGAPMSSQQGGASNTATKKEPEKPDPFADFGMNAFR